MLCEQPAQTQTNAGVLAMKQDQTSKLLREATQKRVLHSDWVDGQKLHYPVAKKEDNIDTHPLIFEVRQDSPV